MSVRRKKGFTLIELIAVLVIMAILALIVTPLVLNIIRKARTAADKRSIDAYGRSIEIAIAGYLLDNGTFPTSIGQLTIEYSGDEVVCSTTQLNGDSSVYLTGCTVGGRSVDYAYGKEETGPTYTAYSVGDQVTYNNINYYVIKDSNASEETVTLLKAEPLSYSDVQTYSQGTGAQTYDQNGYGGMLYGTTSDYSTSYVKQAVDAWKTAQAPAASEARLFTIDELEDFGYEYVEQGSSKYYNKTESTPSWLYNENYDYWTMSPWDDSTASVWSVSCGDDLAHYGVSNSRSIVVRPVITLSKSNLSS